MAKFLKNSVDVAHGAYIQTADPGAVGAKFLWIDTTAAPYPVKRRSDADDAWVTLGVLLDTETLQDIVGPFIVDSSSIDATYDDGANTLSLAVKDGAPMLSPAVETLVDGATVTWATGGKRVNNAQVTLEGNRTLDITGEVDGATGTLVVIQDATGGRTLTLPGSSKVINGGAGAVVLSIGANEIDILTWIFLDSTFYWTIGKDYS